MAELHSEDRDCGSSLQVELGETRLMGGQQWQRLVLRLRSGSRTVSTLKDEESFVCRGPKDELDSLVRDLRLLLSHYKDHLLFEPAEPSFELEFTRTERGGIRVQVWLDAGNGTTGVYTWDASGIRFATTDEALSAFLDQLSAEI